MPDIVDLGNEAAEHFLSLSLRNAQQSVNIAPSSVGLCLSCGSICDGRWCDADCRDDWQAEQKRAG